MVSTVVIVLFTIPNQLSNIHQNMSTVFDVAVIGAGVFGAWTAYRLANSGASVGLIDGYGPGNSRASSGGESRIIRFGYGGDEVYTRSAQRSLALWQSLFQNTDTNLFHQSGVLWLARETDEYCNNVLEMLTKIGARHERLTRTELEHRYPQFDFGPVAWGILEHDGGVLMARRCVQLVVQTALNRGVTYIQDRVGVSETDTRITSLQLHSGASVSAGSYVFACGPWLPKIFPVLLSGLFRITRQEEIFFGAPAADTSFGPTRLPAWIDFNDFTYGLPNLENRGVKLAIDAHGAEFDPDSDDRVVTPEGLSALRSFLKKRMPRLAEAPVLETRVCQYENTVNGDFLIDRHPELHNVWLVGGGSGHGFKHGPVVGEYVEALLNGTVTEEPRFTLSAKQRIHQREVF
jgi:monomeric sarcosine oxidase